MNNFCQKQKLFLLFSKKNRKKTNENVIDCVRHKKVRDHGQITEKYKGGAHVICNLINRQNFSNYITFAFHNLSTYDAHLLFAEQIKQKQDFVRFTFIAETDEKYASNKYGCIRFVDSFDFKNEGLDTLVKHL